MPMAEGGRLIEAAVAAAEAGNTLMALVHLEQAARTHQTPLLKSYLGYCLTREKKDAQKGIALCEEALRMEPANSSHYLNMARICLLLGQKTRAIAFLRKGLKFQRNKAIIELLQSLGVRRESVFPSLSRNHPLNRYSGMILSRLGLR